MRKCIRTEREAEVVELVAEAKQYGPGQEYRGVGRFRTFKLCSTPRSIRRAIRSVSLKKRRIRFGYVPSSNPGYVGATSLTSLLTFLLLK
jgi:hypothetical protein